MRLILATAFMTLAAPVMAACNGPSFYDRLTADERAQIDTAVAATPYATGLVFDAMRDGDKITLIGTMHIYDPRLAAIRTRVAADITAAEILLVEASQDDAAELERFMATNPDIMFLQDGPTLPELLSEDTWEKLATAARERQIPPFMAAKMQPWFLSMSLAIAPCAMADMLAGKTGLDFQLMDDAAAANVPVQSLEHWSTVIDVLRGDTLEDQIKALEIGLLPADIQLEIYIAMIDSYVSGDVAEVWEASRIALNYVPGLDPAEGIAAFAEVEQLILIDRNHDWMPVISTAMDQVDTAVVAVGAAHLPGHDGLLRLLEAEGWTITPRD